MSACGRGVVRVFKTKAFGRFQRKEHIDDKALLAAVTRAERGLIDARLGGCLVKQRVARPGGGGAVAFARSSPTAAGRAQYSCTASPRVDRRISAWPTSATCRITEQ